MDDDQPEVERRITLRRGRMAAGGSTFSAPGTGRVDSIRDVQPIDDVDDAIDPHEINRRVQSRPPLPAPVSPDDARENPRLRLNEVAMAGSPAYAREYRLELLSKMLMRKISLDQIARELQVSISTVEKDRAELRRRWREEAKELNIDQMVGGQNAFYDEVAAMSLRMASAGATPAAMKLAAMRTALAANADRTRMLNTAGVFDVLRFKRAESEADLSDVQLLMQQTREQLALLNEEDEPVEEVQKPRPAIRRRKPDGFGKMDFADKDASGSGTEMVEL